MIQNFDPTLRCVAVPITQSDIGAPLEELFALWADARFSPVIRRETHRPALLVVVNNASDDALEVVRSLYRAQPTLAHSFSGLTVQSADLKGDMDRYVRKPRGREGTFGARAGPNFLFFATMRFAEPFGGFTLQAEVDCLPVEAGWVESTQAVIDGHRSAWVIGSRFASDGELTKETQFHLNGNALYRAGDPLFQSFAHEVWLPRLLRLIKNDHTLPYDCWWAVECANASALKRNEAWRLVTTFGHLIQPDPFVVNLLAKPQDAQAYTGALERFARIGPAPVFLHGAAMTPLRAQLLKYPGDTMLDAIDRLTEQPRNALRQVDLRAQQTPKAHEADWLDRLAGHTKAITPDVAKTLRRLAHEGSTD